MIRPVTDGGFSFQVIDVRLYVQQERYNNYL